MANEERGATINIGAYAKDKAEGLARIVKINGIVTYCYREYTRSGQQVNANAGITREAVAKLVEELPKEIEAYVAAKSAELEAARQALADIDGAQELLPPGDGAPKAI